MIEFKAECGHTVRAKDEDAGGVVRCSYCGRNANVPEGSNDSLDFLFQEIDRHDDASAAPTPAGKRPRTRLFRARRGPKEFDPFAVILRLCYAALLIIIVIFVFRKFVGPLIRNGIWDWRQPTIVGRDKPDDTTDDNDNSDDQDDARPRTTNFGYIAKTGAALIVSTPPGATGYWIRGTDARANESIRHQGSSSQFRVGSQSPPFKRGFEYTIEITFPLNDRQLVSYPGYNEFRRAVLDADQRERRDLVEDYFIPDEADQVFVDQPSPSDRIQIVRRYRIVLPKRGEPAPVRALFLPKLLKEDGVSLDIESLLQYIPPTRMYRLDNEYVRAELLGFHRVPESDEPFYREALTRIGVMPFFVSSRRTLLFKIGPLDGQIDGVLLAPSGR